MQQVIDGSLTCYSSKNVWLKAKHFSLIIFCALCCWLYNVYENVCSLSQSCWRKTRTVSVQRVTVWSIRVYAEKWIKVTCNNEKVRNISNAHAQLHVFTRCSEFIYSSKWIACRLSEPIDIFSDIYESTTLRAHN